MATRVKTDELDYIKLKSGERAKIDPDMYYILSKYTWYAIKRGRHIHAYTKINKKTTYMHRLVIGAKKGQIVDHINMNGLDNRISNLRFVNKAQNSNNTYHLKSITGFRGVGIMKDRKKRYKAYITFNTKQIHLGYFYTAEEAAKAYDNASLKYYGINGYRNFNNE